MDMQLVGMGMAGEIKPGSFVEIGDVDRERPAAILVTADGMTEPCSISRCRVLAAIHINLTPGVRNL